MTQTANAGRALLRIEEFAARLRLPVRSAPGEVTREDTSIALSISRLCLIYGSFILLLMAIPNRPIGRFCFGFCGATMFLVGLFLRRRYSQLRGNVPVAEEETQSSVPAEV